MSSESALVSLSIVAPGSYGDLRFLNPWAQRSPGSSWAPPGFLLGSSTLLLPGSSWLLVWLLLALPGLLALATPQFVSGLSWALGAPGFARVSMLSWRLGLPCLGLYYYSFLGLAWPMAFPAPFVPGSRSIFISLGRLNRMQ